MGHFLAGLIEADGWFGDKELHIAFAESDLSLAYYIKKQIGHGYVYPYTDKKAYRYICKNRAGMIRLLSLINGKLVSNPKYDQLVKHNYSTIYNIEIVKPLLTVSLDNYWLAGFAQGDGCFHISIVKSKTHKTGYSVRLEFSLKQNDTVPLYLVFNLLKLGNVSTYSNGQSCYKSSGYLTAHVLIEYFDRCQLFADKYVRYIKFRKAYIMITEGKHLTDIGIKKLRNIASKGASETSTQKI